MAEVHSNNRNRWHIFLSSLFFVVGFATVFSLVGVLLQTLFAHSSYELERWLDRIGGVIIILFGLFSMGLLQPAFLMQNHTIAIKRRFKSYFLTSFIFGAAFAVGWTPCVSAALGAILALAATQAGSAFVLLFSYTLGIGIPFLLVGLFTDRVQSFIHRSARWMRIVEIFFGTLLVVVGILIFTGELSTLANSALLTNIVAALHISTSIGSSIAALTIVNIAIAFAAGLASFLSPCILPIIPGFLSYLASTVARPTPTL